MLPVLLRFGPITIYTFGFSLFLSCALGMFLVWKKARKKGLSEEKVFDTYLLTVFAALIGGRAGYVFSHFSVFAADYSRMILITHYPGLSFPWALASGLVAVTILAGAFSLDILEILDIFALAFSWAMIVGLGGAVLDGSVKITLIIPFVILAPALWFFYYKIQNKANLAVLARQTGLFISSYLIFLSSSFLIVPGGARKEDNMFYLALLFVGIIIFMVKFPKSVLGQIKDYLEEKHKDAEERMRELKKEDPFEDKSRLLDRASDDSEAQSKFSHERVAAMQQQLNMVLVQTRKALTKIKIGKYGICETCGKMIDTDRLAAIPATTLCLNCEKKKER